MARASRVHAALTALVFVLSGVIGMVHEATTRHVRCEEHGELVDVNVASIANAPARSAAAESADSTLRDAAPAAMHGHEHCSLTGAMRDARAELRTTATVAAPIAIADIATTAPRAIAAPHDALYRTAPKTSPPV
ncbi:MAG TPA: hypothetical protein VH165_35735 [Kofleriaceae bacterium]|jgi:hypothetical protein|nr:hypothetical protein [Kofleriaceae bacterium]